MKRFLSLLSVFSFIASTSTLAVGCQTEVINNDCFDEDWNNITDKDSDSTQWVDIATIRVFMLYLNKSIFPDSNSFYQLMNNKNSTQLIEECFRGPEGELIEGGFSYDFTLLITNYKSIDKDVVGKMQEDLARKTSGMYLFLNLPEIDITDIANEPEINFQFTFMIKNSDGSIIGNQNNNWFYWYDWETTNSQTADKYLLNLALGTAYERVVTKYN